MITSESSVGTTGAANEGETTVNAARMCCIVDAVGTAGGIRVSDDKLEFSETDCDSLDETSGSAAAGIVAAVVVLTHS
jgi:hypothetical protein